MRAWTDQEISLLRTLYPTGSTRELQEAFPTRNIHALSEYARKRGIKCLVERNRLGSLSPLLAETNEAYYWMGFIAADGWFNHKTGQMIVQLALKDKDHLEKLARFLGTNVRRVIQSHWRERHLPTKWAVRVAVQEPLVTKQLIEKFRFKNHKTQNPPDLSWLEGDRFLAFWTGFFDGDGSFCYNRKTNRLSFQIQCHKAWFEPLAIFETKVHQILEVTLPRPLIKIDKRGYALFCSGKQDLHKKFASAITELQIPFLERKWGKVRQVYEI